MCIHLQIGVGICVVLTAVAVTTGKVKNYFDLANFSTSPTALAKASFVGQTALRCENDRPRIT